LRSANSSLDWHAARHWQPELSGLSLNRCGALLVAPLLGFDLRKTGVRQPSRQTKVVFTAPEIELLGLLF
jgi:hypothetical protein